MELSDGILIQFKLIQFNIKAIYAELIEHPVW